MTLVEQKCRQKAKLIKSNRNTRLLIIMNYFLRIDLFFCYYNYFLKNVPPPVFQGSIFLPNL